MVAANLTKRIYASGWFVRMENNKCTRNTNNCVYKNVVRKFQCSNFSLSESGVNMVMASAEAESQSGRGGGSSQVNFGIGSPGKLHFSVNI